MQFEYTHTKEVKSQDLLLVVSSKLGVKGEHSEPGKGSLSWSPATGWERLVRRAEAATFSGLVRSGSGRGPQETQVGDWAGMGSGPDLGVARRFDQGNAVTKEDTNSPSPSLQGEWPGRLAHGWRAVFAAH